MTSKHTMGYIGLIIFAPCIGIFGSWFITESGPLKLFNLIMVFVSITFTFGSLFLALNPYHKVFKRYRSRVKEDSFDIRCQVRHAGNDAKAKQLGVIEPYIKAVEENGLRYSEEATFRIQMTWQVMTVANENRLTCQILLIDMVSKRNFLQSPVIYGVYFKENTEQSVMNFLSSMKSPLNMEEFV